MINWQNLAEKSWTTAHRKQWLVSLIAARRGVATWQLLPDYELSKLKGAWEMYAFIRTTHPVQARSLRKRYEYRRFYELFRLWRLHEFSAEECIEHLEFDGGIAGMVGQVEDVHGAPEWERRGQYIYKTVDKFVHVAYGAPEWFCDWASDTKELFERHGIK